MSRGLSALNLEASQAAHVRPIIFAKLEFGAGTEYLHNALGTYTWGSQTWTGLGDLAEVGPIEEGDELSPYAVELRLNALNTELLTNAQGVQIFERRATLYMGFLGDDGALVDAPDEFWSGSMETMPISLGGEQDSISLVCESEMIMHSYANGALFTDEDQQKRYAGDKGFEFLAQMVDARIQWGPNPFPSAHDAARGGAIIVRDAPWGVNGPGGPPYGP
jgi:hypothetical protein